MSIYDASWSMMLEAEMHEAGDSGPIIYCTLTDEKMERVFNTGFGGNEGEQFTAWSDARVYFPVNYDGAEWVGSAPRNPCDESTQHIGGG